MLNALYAYEAAKFKVVEFHSSLSRGRTPGTSVIQAKELHSDLWLAKSYHYS